MNFKFDYTMNDAEYIDYTLLYAQISPIFKRSVLRTRIVIWFGLLLFYSMICVGSGSVDGRDLLILGILVLLGAVLMPMVRPFLTYSLTRYTEKCLKTKTNLYTPRGYMDFCDNEFTETTELSSVRHQYRAVESVEVLDNHYIYLKVGAEYFILPFTAFESCEQSVAFIEFLRTVCKNVTVHSPLSNKSEKSAKNMDKALLILKIVTPILTVLPTASSIYLITSMNSSSGGCNPGFILVLLAFILLMICSLVQLLLSAVGLFLSVIHYTSPNRTKNITIFAIYVAISLSLIISGIILA